jgi:prepilin-type N-terminal cleavage/methylation domain-containing protein
MTRSGRHGVAAFRNAEAGFTLVEVLSALAILALAMTAVFATFTTQQKSFTVQSRVAEMQQNLRQGVEHMMRDIRLAGYGVPAAVTLPAGVLPSGTTIRALFPVDNTAGPDSIYLLYLYDMEASQPPTWNINPMASGDGSVDVDHTIGFLTAGGEMVLITDGATADLYETSAAVGTVLTFGGGYAYNAVAHGGYGIGPPPATVAKARFVRYYIDSSDAAHPMLMVDRMAGLPPQPVADDIEDVQLQYGLDTTATSDGIVDSWVDNVATSAQIAQIRQVRLLILARTRLPDREWRETRPALGNHGGGGTADGYRRRIADVVVDVRNSGV